MLHAPVLANAMVLNGDTLRFLGNPTHVNAGGASCSSGCLWGHPIGGGAAIPAGGGDYDVPDALAGKTDAQILAEPNADHRAAWEKHLEALHDERRRDQRAP
ncbi:MAG: hypothetical protein R3B70_47850 [Polyangiaceae bacterium]